MATALATAMMKACSAQTGEGTLWPVDPALRPEGKAAQPAVAWRNGARLQPGDRLRQTALA